MPLSYKTGNNLVDIIYITVLAYVNQEGNQTMFLITKKKHTQKIKKAVGNVSAAFQAIIQKNDEDFRRIEDLLVTFAQWKAGSGSSYMSSKAALRGIVEVINERKNRETKQ